MSACFDNLVSMREYCTPSEPKSEIYLNDIGLTKSQVEQIITGDFNTVKALIDATVQMSAKEITTELYGYFSKSIKTHSAIETGVVGSPDGLYTLITGGGYRGVQLSLYNNANYLNFQLAAVSLFVDVTADVDVLVYDLDQNKLLETITVAAVAGQIVEVYPLSVFSSSFKSLNLWIGYDSAGINSYKTLTRKGVCCGNYGRKTDYLKANGTTISGQFITPNLEYIQDTAGIGVRYSIWCDQVAWLCAYSRLLALPVAYKTCAELFRRGLMVSPSSRTNNSTTTNTDVLKMNFDWHESKYRESMTRILSTVHLPKDSACFACNSPTSNVIILP